VKIHMDGNRVNRDLTDKPQTSWWNCGRIGLMNSRIRAVSLFVAAALSSCARQRVGRVVATNEGPGLIKGTQSATVFAFPMEGLMAGKVPSADTDEMGRFQIHRLWFGKYAVSAKKEDEGYADTGGSFCGHNRIDRATLIFILDNGFARKRARLE
jgi:hypothetical protein